MLLLITSYTFPEGQFKASKLTTVCDNIDSLVGVHNHKLSNGMEQLFQK